MNVKIWDGKYAIKSDKNQYKLFALKEKEADAPEDSEEDGVVIGYYPTVRYLLEDLANVEQRSNRCTTMDGYIKHIEKVNVQLEKILDDIQALIGAEESVARIINLVESKMPEKIKDIGEEIKTAKKKNKK